ncbi:response regulator transcription factor [Ramlibacter sp. USB13]|uniref:Response regulator transcription factor n=1 Tax=Ramlibacter cellulosilyticus TaxID=2764187 RepID=A0A923MNR9_9BURK|nr:response regulator transcription factor [Ramlibacter cellulosilyticus]MBC5782106.1 response regulator transcription factor [Ramlibacter cellulosilyticus]
MSTKVLIVEDEPEFLRRFTNAVLMDPDLALAGSAGTGRAAIAMLEAAQPDVVLLDLGLPDIDGVEVIRQAMRQPRPCDVLVVSMFDDDQHVLDSIEAGAAGYLLKDAVPESIVSSIRDLRHGGSPISPGIARRILTRFRVALGPARPATSHSQGKQVNGCGASPLTERETELLRLTAKGLSFDTISELMGISPHTVVAHVRKIYRKLAVHSRGEAVYEATQLGLL